MIDFSITLERYNSCARTRISVLDHIVLIFRAYDRAAIKFRGVDADINFSASDYEEDMRLVN